MNVVKEREEECRRQRERALAQVYERDGQEATGLHGVSGAQ